MYYINAKHVIEKTITLNQSSIFMDFYELFY